MTYNVDNHRVANHDVAVLLWSMAILNNNNKHHELRINFGINNNLTVYKKLRLIFCKFFFFPIMLEKYADQLLKYLFRIPWNSTLKFVMLVFILTLKPWKIFHSKGMRTPKVFQCTVWGRSPWKAQQIKKKFWVPDGLFLSQRLRVSMQLCVESNHF